MNVNGVWLNSQDKEADWNGTFPAGIFARLLRGDAVDAVDLEEPWRSWVQEISHSPGSHRFDIFQEKIRTRADADGLIKSIFTIDPNLSLRNQKSANLLSADQILKTDWSEPEFVVPDLLPTGLSDLAGRPKIGKSWMGLQITHAVAAGGKVFNKDVIQGPVLFLALEDTPRRLKARMLKQHWRPGLPVDFITLDKFKEWIKDFRKGGNEKIAELIRIKKYRLVVVDTIGRLIPGEPKDSEVMSEALEPIHEMAHAERCGILLNDHHRKLGNFVPDVVDDIIGATAKGAIIDTALGLYRERGKAGAKLVVTGRDVEERTLALEMNWVTGCWQCEGDANEIELTERRREILDAIKEMGGKATLKQVYMYLGQDKSNTAKRLKDLVNGDLVRFDGETYTLS